MIRAIGSFIALALAAPTSGVTTQAPAFVSPCPNVFTYEPLGAEPGKWYGVVNLTTDTTLYALWLNVVLESKADILGNWVGEVTTDDNTDFKIENTKMKISPGSPLAIRFFIQYNAQNPPPKLKAIRFNGREICNVETPQEVHSEISSGSVINYGQQRTDVTTSTTVRPTATTTSRSFDRQQTTLNYWQQTEKPTTKTTQSLFWTQATTKAQFWTEAKTTNSYQATSQIKEQTTLKPQYWQQAKTESNQRATTKKNQQTTVQPQYWTQAKTEVKTQTTAKPQVWSQVKNHNNQSIRAEVKMTTENNVQSKNQPWSYGAVDNQKTKSQDINNKPENIYQVSTKTSTEVFPQIVYEVTTESQVWAQYKVQNDQQTTSRTGLQSKNENTHRTTEKSSVWPNAKVTGNQYVRPKDEQIRAQNVSRTESVQTQYWPKITGDDNLGVRVKQPSRTETDGTLHRQSTNSQNKQQSSSFIWAETEQNAPKDNYQSKTYEQLQVKPVDSNQHQRQSAPIYVRPENNQTGDNLQTKPKLPILVDSVNRQRVTPLDSYEKRPEDRNQYTQEGILKVRPIKKKEQESQESWSGERTSSWSGDGSQSWSSGSKNQMQFQTGVDSSSYTDDSRVKHLDDEDSLPYNKYQLTTAVPLPTIFKMPDNEDYDSSKKEDVEYYVGGIPMIYVPYHGPRRQNENECGKVLLNKNAAYKQRSRITLEGQWPWQIALYQQQTSVDFKYICGGTLVSRRHIITAAHCVTRKGSIRVVNMNTLTVYLGKHNLRNSVEGVQVKFVGRILVHPEYNATTFRQDLAILELRDSVTFSDRVQPACLWPENEIDLRHIIGQKGSVVGWGFEVSGAAKEELSLLEMPVVDQETCFLSFPAFFGRYTSEKTYCAGHIDGTGVCNGDSGGGMVFEKHGSWYLRGVASLSVARKGEYRCDPDHYVIFTDVAKLLPWIEDNIEDLYR